MYSVKFSPLAKEDLKNLKKYLASKFDEELSNKVLRELLKSIRKFEKYPLMGRAVTNLIDIHTDYLYFVVGKNYVFYRIEDTTVKIVRILDTRRDFIQVLFGIEF